MELGLKWISTQQSEDGFFQREGYDRSGATALSLLAFIGHGHLPQKSPYGPAMIKAKDRLVDLGTEYEGYLSLRKPPTVQTVAGIPTMTSVGTIVQSIGIAPQNIPRESLIYWTSYLDPIHHAMIVTGLSEFDSCSPDPKLDKLLQLAVSKIVAAQNADGSWNEHFIKESVGCTLTTAWQVLALRAFSSTKLADAQTKECLDKAVKYSEKLGHDEPLSYHGSINYPMYVGGPNVSANGSGAYLVSFRSKKIRPPDLSKVYGLTSQESGAISGLMDTFFAVRAASKMTEGHPPGIYPFMKSVVAKQQADGTFSFVKNDSYIDYEKDKPEYLVHRTALMLLILEAPYLYPNRPQ